MLFYVNSADQSPEGDVKVAFKNKSDDCNFDIVSFKPRYYLLVAKLPFTSSFDVASKEFAYCQEQTIVDYHSKHWSDSENEVGSTVSCLFKDGIQ
jgi:hypothetical protein